LGVSITYRCNSRCKTCRIYKKKGKELSLQEYEKIFSSLGKDPYWITLSGGEPFLRKDIVQLCQLVGEICQPAIINIPTNGILSDFIIESVSQIAQHNNRSKIIINMSLDDIGKKHDELRGVKGNFKKVMSTYRGLKELDYPNLTVGIHTVISKFNVKRFPTIVENLLELEPDSFICEIAEKRRELGTLGLDIAPNIEDYSDAIQLLIDNLRGTKFFGISRLTQAFRMNYYDLTIKMLKQEKQVIPCYAGFASAHIAPDGGVWMCAVKAESIGNIKDAGYNFKTIWFSDEAKQARKTIKKAKCYCPFANVSYTNMLLNMKSLAKVSSNYLKLIFGGK